MEFITLDEAVQLVADAMPARDGSTEERSHFEAGRASDAAATIHEHLLNAPATTTPRWVAKDPRTNRPVFNDDVAAEGLDMLAVVAGWADRNSKAHVRHVRECFSFGMDQTTGLPLVDPATTPPTTNPDHGRYGTAVFFRWRDLGFDREELVRFFQAAGIVHCPAHSTQASMMLKEIPRPVQRAPTWEAMLVDTARDLGLDPLNLPPLAKNSRLDVKRNFFTALVPSKMSKEVFKKAWKQAHQLGTLKRSG